MQKEIRLLKFCSKLFYPSFVIYKGIEGFRCIKALFMLRLSNYSSKNTFIAVSIPKLFIKQNVKREGNISTWTKQEETLNTDNR